MQIIQFNVVFIVCCHLHNALVSWDIISEPVIFEKDVILFCNLTLANTCSGCTYSWYGGEDLDLLTHNNVSTNITKYISERDNIGFYLTIKMFSENDVNVQYSCSYGIEWDKKNLSMRETFELQPTEETKNVTYFIDSNSNLIIQGRFLKVYPEPKCFISFNKQDITEQLQCNSTKVGLFYRMTFRLNYHVDDDICKLELSMNCSIGTQQYVLIHDDLVNNCIDKSSEPSMIPFILGAFGGLILVAVIISCSVGFRYVRVKSASFYENERLHMTQM